MASPNELAKQVRHLLLDVDGVLTNGLLFYGAKETMRGFHIHDGLGLKWLQKLRITVGIITAKKTPDVVHRLADLNLQHIYLGYEDKLPAYKDFKQKLNAQDDEIAYMGDDLPDLAILKRVGFAITVPKACPIVKQHADYITKNKGGKGAVREVCDLILMAQDKYQIMVNSYLEK